MVITNRLAGYLRAAGSKNPNRDLLILLLIPFTSAGAMHEWLAVSGLSLAALCIAFGVEYEYLQLRIQARKRKVYAAWPIVVESLESAAIAGMSLLESLRDIAESDQLFVAEDFAALCNSVDSGTALEVALDELKTKLATQPSDFTIELLKITNQLGSSGYVAALKNQTTALRLEANLQSELEAKQGWVVGTAKLAVLAPWLIVSVLSIRPENASIYRSLTGTAILLLGLVGSAAAMRMVYRIGRLTASPRVFA